MWNIQSFKHVTQYAATLCRHTLKVLQMILFWVKGYPQLAWNEWGCLLGRTTTLYIGSSASVLKGHKTEDECEIPVFICKQTNILGLVIKPLHMVHSGKQNLHIMVC